MDKENKKKIRPTVPEHAEEKTMEMSKGKVQKIIIKKGHGTITTLNAIILKGPLWYNEIKQHIWE